MIDELTMRRLAMVKCLYSYGIQLSYQIEPNNGFCLLPFHDSVEMFLGICAEKCGMKVKRDTTFGDYFSNLPQLSSKEQMMHLNERRVALKHHGNSPSNIDVEISRANVTEFFESNTKQIFDIEFSQISLISVIENTEVKAFLQKSEDCRISEDYVAAVVNAHWAYWALNKKQREDFSYWYQSLLTISPSIERIKRLNLNFEPHLDRALEKQSKEIKKVLEDTDDAIIMLGIGVDFMKYCLFRSTAPMRTISPVDVEYNLVANDKVKYNENTAQFCFDFVIDVALKMQRFHCDINDYLQKPYA